MKSEPFRIGPVFSPRLWGSCSLAPLFPDKANLGEPLGEAWLTGVDCKIATGPFAGKSLGDAWKNMPAEWRGTRLASTRAFPILVKFIFPNDKLSVQVHPDDAYAAKHEQAAGGRGKTEMWHAVSAEARAQVFIGLKPGVDKQKFRAALDAASVEDLFKAHTVSPGDTFFVPAGTPHTIGPGMVLCEVQEYSDLTYRVYDYGRVDANGKPRALHVDKALDVMKFDSSRAGKVPPLRLPADRISKALLAACPYFATERSEFRSTLQLASRPDCSELIVILQGIGYIHAKPSVVPYTSGQCWLIPASLGPFSLQPETTTSILRTYVPDLAKLCAELRRYGVSDAQLAKVIFD